MGIPGTSKIGRRIVVLVLVAVSLSIVSLTGAFLWLQLRDGVEARRAYIEATGYVFASAIADPVSSGDRQGVFNALRSIRRIPDVNRAVALDRDGRQIASFGSASMLEGDIVDNQAGWTSLLTRGWFPVAIDIVKAGVPVGRLIIVADISSLRTHAAKAMLLTLLSALIAGGIGVASAIRLQRRITNPINSLTRAMTHIREARDYSMKVVHQSDDETGVLVDAFNGMMSEIGYRDDALKRLAYFDPLTGLANRQEFQRRLEAVLRRTEDGGPGAALFLLDLDQFKSVNDSYGHVAGDTLLMDVAARFKAECSESMLLARLGGDEFAVIADGIVTVADAQLVLAPLIATLHRPVEIFGRQILIGASTGVALIPRDGRSTADLLRRADLALYSAKREGRARVNFYHPRLDEDMQVLMELAQDLHHAVQRGELEAHYQPQVEIRTGRIVGFESLLRWRHPRYGYVSPGRFIPLAESNGLICDLGQWILNESCRQIRIWLDQGLDARQVSVNVSVAQLRQLDFHLEVERILEAHRLPGSRVCLEMTESLFAGNALEPMCEALKRLKALGVELAIDDFGTGYSIMAYLQTLPFDKLKIDRVFVSHVDRVTEKRRLLRGMIELAHALNLSIIAEGAETAGELAVLEALKAEQVQGYVYSKPVSADAVSEMLSEHTHWRAGLALSTRAS